MTRYTTIAATLFVAVLTLIGGIIHGRMSNRWGPTADAQRAAERLDEFPSEFKDWKMVSTRPLSRGALEQLQCVGYFNRIYTNHVTGDAVTVTLIVGPMGPTAAHTPEVCYSSRDDTIVDARSAVSVGDPEQAGAQFWTIVFRANDLNADLSRVYYGWSTGDHWLVPDRPRFEFAGYPYLYKIQVTSHSVRRANQEASDPGRRFLTDFAPIFRDYLIPCHRGI
jgi:hypothetical protein